MALRPRLVREDELRALVPMKDAIEAVRDAYVGFARGDFSAVPRIAAPTHTLFVMMSERVSPNGTNLGQSVKVVSYHEENPAAGRPVIAGVVLWFDGQTGEAQLVLDGAAVTALRTGAASGVATDLLAAPEARTLALIGTGATAPDQIRAVCAVRDIREVAVAGRDFQKTEAFVAAMRAEFPSATMTAERTVGAAIAGADVICTATTARAPLFDASELKGTAHVNAVGAFSPQMCELGPNVAATARQVCVDDRAALADCGDLLAPLNAKLVDAGAIALIGDLLARQAHMSGPGISLFKSIGIAAQDWAIAARVASVSA